ncbi:hypothetical protein A1O3_01917 [Capronia epimyces CBS 606.96]|uniref:DNA (cytosine-5-)-methyltransferase n=1 Tax=Capronia epimyces CBS 606.96 TaxID=1182542 RepID=W9Y8M8_9EURO|nr:uncharacterized protein A1O3_01917 [Capronia epimyces CBS 606.96]EXJ88853.1 hypothetical protein A1O3_01917 [Capronia epimyces CBS 606.96]
MSERTPAPSTEIWDEEILSSDGLERWDGEDNVFRMTASISPIPTLKDLLTGLAQRLEVWESPQDLERLYPQTLRTGFQMPQSSEEDILNEFGTLEDGVLEPAAKEHFQEIHIQQFCVYRAPQHPQSPGQFEYLSAVVSELAPTEDYTAGLAEPCWLIDGLLVYRGLVRQIFAAEVIAVEIGELGNLEAHSTEGSIWIMTVESEKKNYWYRLQLPSKVYLPYWTNFAWLADFAKFFLDYLCIGNSVQLSDFRSKFWTWLLGLHGEKLQIWHTQCAKRTDFRQHVLSYAPFLYHEACVLGRKGTTNEHASRMSHPIWVETGVVKASQTRRAALKSLKTTVTPNIAASFLRFSAWQRYNLLEVLPLSSQVEAYRARKIRQWGFPDKFKVNQREKAALILEEAGEQNGPVDVSHAKELLGKVVVVRAKKDDGQYEFNYAWVRKTMSKTISVIWLVLPSDTICGSRGDATVSYPIGNELFFSDQCSCEDIHIEDVVRIVEASVLQDPTAPGSELFVQSLYREEEEAITNVTESELSCRCLLHGQRSSEGRHLHPTQRGNRPKLRGLSLFSGGGLFDHAFTSNGSSEIVFAVEHCEIAARSYQANDDTNCTQVEIGSVEEGLDAFASGRKPLPEIDFIIGGFPCPYYSTLNVFRDTRKSQKNGSLLANMLSWIELFLPPYVLMENVPNMDRLRPNACRQAICQLVALGYQVRKSIHLDSRLGGASIRERLFVVAAAPGVILPDRLVDTHGPAGSGLRKIRTVSEVIGDLDTIENDTSINIRDPSHVPLHRLGLDFKRQVSYRSLVRQIPTQPECMSLSKTYYNGGLLPHQRRFFEGNLHPTKQARNSQCLRRVDPDAPFRTVCTITSPMDARFGGHIIHPLEHRTLSLKEGGRRAMGMPDRFLLAGSVEEQYKQCGNGVPWAMGAGWGRNFARAWFASLDRRAQTQGEASGTASITWNQGDVCRVKTSTPKEDADVIVQKRRGLSSTLYDGDGGGGGDDGGNASDSSVEIIEVRPVKKRKADCTLDGAEAD